MSSFIQQITNNNIRSSWKIHRRRFLFQKGARVQNSEILHFWNTYLKCEILKQDKCPKYAGFEISGRPGSRATTLRYLVHKAKRNISGYQFNIKTKHLGLT
jgi:hypothetical protein